MPAISAVIETRKTQIQTGIRQRSLRRHCCLGRATELVFVLATGVTLMLGGQARAQTWDGDNNQNWSNAQNWNPNGVPANGGNVIINGAGGGNANSTVNSPTNNLNSVAISASTVTVNSTLNATTITVSGTGGLIINSGEQVRGSSTPTDTTLNANGGTVTNNGTITGALNVGGANVTNTGGVTGATSISAGTLNLNTGTNLANGQVLTVTGGQVNVNADETVGGLAGGPAGTIAFTAGNGLTIDNTSPAASTYSGAINGATTNGDIYFVKDGTGTQTLSGANTTTGGGIMRVLGGTLVLSGGNAVGNTNVLETTTGIADLQANETVGGLLGATTGTLQLNGNTLTIAGGTGFGGSITLGNITGTGGVTINGAGYIQQFDTALAYTGNTTVTAGTFQLGASGIIDDASNVVVNGGTLSMQGFNDTVAGVSLQSGSITGTGTLTSSTTFDVQSGSASAVLAGTVGLNKTTAGAATLTGANTYTGTTAVTAGTLNITGAGSVASTAVNVSGTGTLTTDDNALAATAVVGVSGTGTFTANGTDGLGAINQSGGTVNGTGALALTGAFTQTGGTTGGTLGITSNGFSQSGGAILAAGTTVTSLVGAQTLSGGTIAGTLDGSGAITVQTGTTTVSGTISIAPITVNSRLVLTGTAVINPAVTVDGGALNASGSVTVLPSVSTANAATFSAAAGQTLTLTTLNPGAGSALTFGETGQTGTVQVNNASTPDTGVVIAAGTLRIGGTDAGADLLSGTAGTTINANGTLDVNGIATTVTALTGSGTVTNGNATGATLSLQGTSNFSGAIQNGTGTTAVTVVAGNTATLSGTNTYTGVTTIGAGATLNIANGNAIANGGEVALNGGTLEVNASEQIGTLTGATGTVDLNGNDLTLGTTGTAVYSGGVTGTATSDLIKVGTGTQTIGGTVNTAGTVQVRDGTLALGGTNTITGGITVGVVGGTETATLRLLSNGAAGGATGSITTLGSVISYANGVDNATPINVNSNDTQLEVQSTHSATQSGVISETAGPRPIEKIGSGTLIMTAANTYTGATTISGGLLLVQSGSALSDTANVNITASGANTGLQIDTAQETIGSLTGVAGSAVINNAGLVTGNDDTSTTFNGVISGTGFVQKLGTGTQTLTGVNTYTGGTTISAGTLELTGSGSILNTSSITIDPLATLSTDGGALASTAAIRNDGTFALTAGGDESIARIFNTGTSNPGAITLSAGSELTLNAGISTISGVVSGQGALVVQGTSDTTLSGTNSYSGGTTVSGTGILTVAATGTVVGLTTVNTGGTLTNNGSVATVTNAGTFTNNLTAGAVTNQSGGTFTNAATGTAASVASAGTTSNAGIISGTLGVSAGTTTNTGTVSGLTTVSGGTLEQDGGSLAGLSVSAGTVNADGGTITGTGTVTGGTLNLNGATTSALAVVNNGGTVNAVIGSSIGSLAGAGGTINTNANQLQVTGSATTTYAGAMTGTGQFSNSGSGSLTLTGNGSAFTGSLVSVGAGGSLLLTGAGTTGANGVGANTGSSFGTDGGALLNTSVVLASVGQVTFTGSETVGTITNGGAGVGSGTITLTGAGTTLTVNGSANALNPANVNGTTGTVNGTGTLNVTGGTFSVGTTGQIQTTTTVAAPGTLSNSGTMATVTNGGTVTNNAGATIAALTNNGTATNAGTITTVTNNTGATLTNNNIVGPVTNTGAFTNTATAGAVTNTGAGTFTNTGTGTAASLASSATASNAGIISGTLTVSGGTTTNTGAVNGLTTVSAGTLEQDGGTLNGLAISGGAIVNADGGTVNGAKTLTGGTLNARGASFGATPINNNGGIINVTAATVANVNNNTGSLNVNAGGVLTGTVVNAATTTIAAGGQVSGNVTNTGTLNLNGGITGGGNLTNSGTVNANGAVAGNVVNQTGGLITLAAGNTAAVGGTLTNNSGANVSIATGASLTTGGFVNQAGATLANSGTLYGSLNNAGLVTTTPGVFAGPVTNSGTMTAGSLINITSSLNNLATGGINGANLTVAGATTNAGTIAMTGAANFGVLTNNNILTADTVTATGLTTNNTTISTVGNMTFAGGLAGGGTLNVVGAGDATDVITVGGGGITGGVTLQFDANLNPVAPSTAGASDRLVMSPGAALTGQVNLEFAVGGTGGGVDIDDLLVIDVAAGAANAFTLGAPTGLPNSGGKFVYALDQLGVVNGDVYLRTFLNPGISGLAGNVTLTQSLIGSVINRPSSPFVSGLAYDDPDSCGPGVWGRAIGGAADATGSTSDGTDSFSSELSATYAGVQLGGDFACFNGFYNGWDLAFGGIVGLNNGSVDQPVFAIDPSAPGGVSNVQTSTTTADFNQYYGGVYTAAVRGPLAIDLQYRVEKTDFDLTNTPIGGSSGLGLTGTQFSSKAQTLSGSVSYAFPIADTNLTVLPVAGFAWTKTKTDPIVFDNGDTLEVDDFDNKTGFVGATVARSVFAEDGNSAFNQFVTATYYNDFAADPTSIFNYTDPDTNAGQVDNLVNQNLGAYGELSVGLNYVRILNPGQAIPARQLNASIRADARFGDQLNSWGLTGQVRLQF